MNKTITGHKGGSKKPRQPVEMPDSVRSIARAKILLALGEGEFDGGVDGRSIYLDDTPLLAADGSVNFPGVTWEFRPGSVDQEHIAGVPAVENELAVGVELKSDAPWVRAVNNTQLSAVRLRLSWPAIQRQQENGDVVGYRIDYAIDIAVDGGAWQEALKASLDDKSTSRYERSHRVDLPEARSGWQVRVRRLTPNQNNNRIADTMRVEAITEVIDAKLRYPNTALLFVEFDASQFQSIPQISVEARGRRVRVPSNYDPQTRSYSGTWDGSFKSAWTSNPAWHWYDIVLHKRFGLGRRIDASMVDKWSLYRIAQYCDQSVPDGKGGQEPRFSCNLYLQSRAEAWTVLRDLAAIFRGMSYWSGAEMVAVSDMPEDEAYTFSPSNTVRGDDGSHFNYSSSRQRDRHTLALVNYDNPGNGYQSQPVAVNNDRAQRRYGISQLEITAIGCTSEGEAQRRGQWALLTEELEQDAVTFRTGMDGRGLAPGKIIAVADPVKSGKQIGGRLSAVDGRALTLDRDVEARPGDRLLVNLPNGKAEARSVQSVVGRVLSVTAAYSETPRPQGQWALQSNSLTTQRFRIMSITRPEDNLFEITALQHNASKFDAIDNGARIELPPVTSIPPGVQAPPQNVRIKAFTKVDQGLAVTSLSASWDAAPNAVAYEAEWRKDSGNWVRVPRTSALGFDVPGIYAGRYLVRVRALNVMEVGSVYASSVETALEGKTTPPPALAYLRCVAGPWRIGLEWGFPASGAADTAYTEIQQSATPGGSEETARALGLFAYPGNTHLVSPIPAGERLAFRGRLIDRSGNVGAWSNWVTGTSSSDASEYNQLITQEYVESALGQQFFSDIERMQVDIGGLQKQVGDLADILLYDPAKVYAKNDMVRQGQRLYQALKAVPAKTAPPNAAYWSDIGQSLETANGLAQQVASHTAEISELDGSLTAQASRLGVLQAATRDDADDGNGAMADALRGWKTVARAAQEETVRATENEAQATRTTLLEARTADAEGRIATVERVATSDRQATAQRLDQLSASIGGTAASLQSEQTARANADSALAQRIDTVQARTDTNSAAIQTTSQAVTSLDGNVKAMYSVKLQAHANGQKYAAGWQLGFDSGTSVSTMAFQADRFIFFDSSSGAVAAPVSIVGGKIFINSAIIKDGSITSAKIEDSLQSENYESGTRGWRIDKSGSFELNGEETGLRRVLRPNYDRYYDTQSGILVIEIGELA
ncbi:TPA: phage tail protein [Pseudomonas aeruginosa]|uniref:phage tail protein n=1 Tax=Pseudomonas aeruginosa TaxID=287 RepID=UPI00050DE7AA|nr:phage tail protein [Pseudomonas aeruginosa]EKQ6383011.1 phage tail protein [Pseudomonas aeruginosa]KGD88334.1 Lambda phage tail fiber protein J [Pseudomonas aeruginosa]KSI97691.1 phage tail protein [Pseudomonas aeruginosa]MBF3182063.1 phage tail protein [Pseudomonas aeruginosa]MBI7438284.1 phage tail protein [Pseudomonas aeruginosa]